MKISRFCFPSLGVFLFSSAALVLFSSFSPVALASHGAAAVSDVDGDFGNDSGSLSNSYVHVDGSLGDHPWYTFDASAGELIDITLETNFGESGSGGLGSYLWLYLVDDGSIDIGDEVGSGLTLVAQSSNQDTLPGPFVDQEILGFAAPATSQYAIQVDSWLGGSGDYTLSLSRVPEPTTMVLALLGMLGSCDRRLHRSRR